MDQRVTEIFNAMEPDELIGQLFLVSFFGRTVPTSLEELITDYHVGAVYIHGRNLWNTRTPNPTAAEQVAALANTLQGIAWNTNRKTDAGNGEYYLPLFLAVDHEGDGKRLTRIRTGMTAIPSPLAIGATWSSENAEDVGWIVGQELSAIGINMLLGPVLDVMDDPSNNEESNLDTRVFGGDPFWVGELGRAYIRGVHCGSDNRLLTVAKHFPGHGDSDRATDDTIAITRKSTEELLRIDLVPFIRVTEEVDEEVDEENDEDCLSMSGVSDAFMSSHISIEATHPRPISLFRDHNEGEMGIGGITQLMRVDETLARWHEHGFVVVDNLGVGALGGEFSGNRDEADIALEALLAGNDLLIVHDFIRDSEDKGPEEIHEVIAGVMEFFEEEYDRDDRVRLRINQAAKKIIRAKLRMYGDGPELVLLDKGVIPAEIDRREKEGIIKKIAKEAIAILKSENYQSLPENGLSEEDTILFIVHNVRYKECDDCTNDWPLLRRSYFSDYLAELEGFEDPQKLISMDYYTEYSRYPYIEPGLSQFLYLTEFKEESIESDHWLLNVIPDDREEREERELQDAESVNDSIQRADWIVFAFFTGDCGPDGYWPYNPEQRSSERKCSGESDTLLRFLEVYTGDPGEDDPRQKQLRDDARVVAVAFGAPSWNLGLTDVSKLDIYIGAFNQLIPFQEQVMQTLLREFNPTGASPIDVEGANYLLRERLKPDENQGMSLSIKNPPVNGKWVVGDIVELETSVIEDYNGNPIVSDIEIAWTGQNNTRLLKPISASQRLKFGVADAQFELLEPGSAEIQFKVSGLKPFTIEVEPISEQKPVAATEEAPAATPTIVTPTAMNTVAATPEAITPTVTETITITPEPVVTPMAEPPDSPEPQSNLVAWVLVLVTLFLGLPSSWLAYKRLLASNTKGTSPDSAMTEER